MLLLVATAAWGATPNEIGLQAQLAEARAQLVRAGEATAARNAEDARVAAAAAVLTAALNAENARKSTSWLAMVSAMLPVVAFIGGLAWWAVKVTMRVENARQLVQINGTYTRSHGATVTGAELQREHEEIRQEIASLRQTGADLHTYAHELHEYSHVAVHDLRNAIARVEALQHLLKLA